MGIRIENELNATTRPTTGTAPPGLPSADLCAHCHLPVVPGVLTCDELDSAECLPPRSA
ncbi:MAG: hypothetical protein ACLVJH_04500 [Faecalibacterium prausnitzii]